MLKLTPGAYPFPIKHHNLLYVWGTSACCVLINSDIWLLYLVKISLWNRQYKSKSCIYQPRFSFCFPHRMTCVWLWFQQWKLSVHLFMSGCICVLSTVSAKNIWGYQMVWVIFAFPFTCSVRFWITNHPLCLS